MTNICTGYIDVSNICIDVKTDKRCITDLEIIRIRCQRCSACNIVPGYLEFSAVIDFCLVRYSKFLQTIERQHAPNGIEIHHVGIAGFDRLSRIIFRAVCVRRRCPSAEYVCNRPNTLSFRHCRNQRSPGVLRDIRL